jgi:hypothetical protein
VVRTSIATPAPEGEITLTATLETARRSARTDGSCVQRSWHGHSTSSQDPHGVTERRLRFTAPGTTGVLRHADTISIDLVTGIGSAPVLLTDLPSALGLRGGSYVLASVESPIAD